MSSFSHYEVLGVEPTATAAEIKTAYRARMRNTHPDTGGSTGLFLMVQSAFETLSDPAKRADYDTARNGPQLAEEHREEPQQNQSPDDAPASGRWRVQEPPQASQPTAPSANVQTEGPAQAQPVATQPAGLRSKTGLWAMKTQDKAGLWAGNAIVGTATSRARGCTFLVLYAGLLFTQVVHAVEATWHYGDFATGVPVDYPWDGPGTFILHAVLFALPLAAIAKTWATLLGPTRWPWHLLAGVALFVQWYGFAPGPDMGLFMGLIMCSVGVSIQWLVIVLLSRLAGASSGRAGDGAASREATTAAAAAVKLPVRKPRQT